jgi:hypothetical protein
VIGEEPIYAVRSLFLRWESFSANFIVVENSAACLLNFCLSGMEESMGVILKKTADSKLH